MKITITTSATVSSNVKLYVFDRGPDGLGTVGNDRNLDGGGYRRLEHRHHRLDPVHRLDDVGSGLTLDGQQDRPLLVVPGRNQLVLAGTDCAADIAYSDWRPVCYRRRSGRRIGRA
jgi:hypothetical protein